MNSFGSILKELRIEKGILQRELADHLKVSRVTITQYESDTRSPDDETKKKIAEYFNVSLDYLMGNSPWRNSREEFEFEYELEASESLKSALRFFIKENINDDSKITEELRIRINNYAKNNSNLSSGQLIVNFVDDLLFSNDMKKNTKIIEDLGYYDEVDPEDHNVTNIYKTEYNKNNHYPVDDVEEAMKIILDQPGLMLKGEILSDESKIILANAIQMGLRTAEELEKKKGDNND